MTANDLTTSLLLVRGRRQLSFARDPSEGGGQITSKGDGLLRSNLPLGDTLLRGAGYFVTGLFKCQRRSIKQFSPLWRPCEVGVSLFLCGKHLITPFKPPRWCCETRAGQLKCQRRPRKQFSPLRRTSEARACLFMCGKDLITPF